MVPDCVSGGEKPVLFMGVNGEGLGHSIRALALSEQLSRDYQVHLFSSGKAFEYLERMEVPHLHQINGLHFSRRKAKVRYLKSTWNVIKFVCNHRNELHTLRHIAERLRPVAILTDFEPLLPRLAHKLQLPLISVDSQHRFSHCYIPCLPLLMRVYQWVVRFFVQLFIPRPDLIIVSAAHFDWLTPRKENITITNVFLRKAFFQNSPATEDFVLVYCKKFLQYQLLSKLRRLPESFRIYGALGPHAPNFEFKGLNNEEFVRDLARCKAVIATGGNQLMGEARYMGKPLLVIPEPGQYEQKVNAALHHSMGLGKISSLYRLTGRTVKEFLRDLPTVPRIQVNGAKQAAQRIQAFLAELPSSKSVLHPPNLSENLHIRRISEA